MLSHLKIGNDISKNWFDVHYSLNDAGVTARFANNPAGHEAFIQNVGKLAKKVHVCMEYTGGYETACALAMKEAGFRVSLVAGSKIAHYRRSFSSSGAGSDKQSALLLYRYCKERNPEEWFPMPQDYRKLRELVRHRQDLLELRTQVSNRGAHDYETEFVKAQSRTQVEVLSMHIEATDKEIARHVKEHSNLAEAVTLVDGVPGVGFISAVRIVAETGPIDNYADARAYALAAGLAPICAHSGQKTPAGKLPVYGNANLRCGFYFPAVVNFRKDTALGRYMARIESNANKKKMTIIAAGMRKIAHIVFGILKSGKPYDPQIHGCKTGA